MLKLNSKGASNFFRAGNICWNKRSSINISSTTDERKNLHGGISKFFLLDTPLRCCFSNELSLVGTQYPNLFRVLLNQKDYASSDFLSLNLTLVPVAVVLQHYKKQVDTWIPNKNNNYPENSKNQHFLFP